MDTKTTNQLNYNGIPIDLNIGVAFSIYKNKIAYMHLTVDFKSRLKLFDLLKNKLGNDFNKDFYELPNLVEKYLNKKEEINYYSEDNRKGELVSRKVTIKGNKTITEEYWKPKRSDELPWKMLYDRYDRTVDEIYKRDGSIK
jgi:hypothetical protein